MSESSTLLRMVFEIVEKDRDLPSTLCGFCSWSGRVYVFDHHPGIFHLLNFWRYHLGKSSLLQIGLRISHVQSWWEKLRGLVNLKIKLAKAILIWKRKKNLTVLHANFFFRAGMQNLKVIPGLLLLPINFLSSILA